MVPVPAGVMTRDGSTFDSPPQIPDLIGIRDRRYLNHTGTKMHRSIGDLMRYAALAQGADAGSSWGDFRLGPEVPPFAVRYTDEALYALALYLYSLSRQRIRTTWTRNPVPVKWSSNARAAVAATRPRFIPTTS